MEKEKRVCIECENELLPTEFASCDCCEKAMCKDCHTKNDGVCSDCLERFYTKVK